MAGRHASAIETGVGQLLAGGKLARVGRRVGATDRVPKALLNLACAGDTFLWETKTLGQHAIGVCLEAGLDVGGRITCIVRQTGFERVVASWARSRGGRRWAFALGNAAL
jgi:hypothetical protein